MYNVTISLNSWLVFDATINATNDMAFVTAQTTPEIQYVCEDHLSISGPTIEEYCKATWISEASNTENSTSPGENLTI